MDWSIIINLAVIVGTSVSVYVAIRMDLASMHERIKAADARIDVVSKEADKAHDRIDDWYRREVRS